MGGDLVPFVLAGEKRYKAVLALKMGRSISLYGAFSLSNQFHTQRSGLVHASREFLPSGTALYIPSKQMPRRRAVCFGMASQV